MAVEAIWNDVVIAHSDKTVIVEGNHYFPRVDVDPSVLERSDTTTVCPWKGTAHYYTIDLDGERMQIVRMRGQFVVAGVKPSRIGGVLATALSVTSAAYVEFVNAEIDGKY